MGLGQTWTTGNCGLSHTCTRNHTHTLSLVFSLCHSPVCWMYTADVRYYDVLVFSLN